MPFERKAKGITFVANRANRFVRARRFVRAKRRTQVKRNERKHINSLPEELLCMVFDHLKLKRVKAAALTCRKWNDLIFSTGYMNRFVFKIDLVVPIPDSIANHMHSIHREQKLLELEELKKTHAEKTLRAINESQRSYRTVRCSTYESMSLHNSSILAAVHQKFGNNLSTLDLRFDYNTLASMFPWIIETIPLMPQLETLKLGGSSYKRKDQAIRPTLRSQTLKHFVLESTFKVWLDTPKLHSFDGSLLVLDRPDDCLQSAGVPSLKHLTISVEEKDDGEIMEVTRQLTIIRLLPPIETVVWKLRLSNDELFLAICETCTALTNLTVHYDISLSNISLFSNLEKLRNLRSLSVGSLLTSNESALHFDFSSLTSLEKLAIEDTFVDSLVLPRSVKSLALVIDKRNERSMIQTILSRSVQLTELVLFYIYVNPGEQMPIETLKILPRLKNLQVLEFYGGYFEKSTFLCLESPMKRLHTLKLEKDFVDPRRFLGLKEKFPNLKQLVMKSYGSKRPQRSTNPDLFESRPRLHSWSDSDLDSWYGSERDPDPDSDIEPNRVYSSDDDLFF